MGGGERRAGDYRMRDKIPCRKGFGPANAGAKVLDWRNLDLFADPGLSSADEGYASGHVQFVASGLQLGLRFVGLAVGGVQDRAARPFIGAVGLQIPQYGHALDRLVLVGAAAFVA